MSKPFGDRSKEIVPTGAYFTCKICGVEQDTSQFTPDKTVRRGFRSRCRSCSRELMRKHRASGKADTKNSTNEKKKAMVRAAKAKPCADCGLVFPYFVMDLDHLPEFEKSFQLGKYMQYTLGAIKQELDKCEAVCANCHRWRTAKRVGLVE